MLLSLEWIGEKYYKVKRAVFVNLAMFVPSGRTPTIENNMHVKTEYK
jgi:hypothetical protein